MFWNHSFIQYFEPWAFHQRSREQRIKLYLGVPALVQYKIKNNGIQFQVPTGSAYQCLSNCTDDTESASQ